MDINVSYEYSHAADTQRFIVLVPAQLVVDVPADIPRALPTEYITGVILERSPLIGKIRSLRIL